MQSSFGERHTMWFSTWHAVRLHPGACETSEWQPHNSPALLRAPAAAVHARLIAAQSPPFSLSFIAPSPAVILSEFAILSRFFFPSPVSRSRRRLQQQSVPDDPLREFLPLETDPTSQNFSVPVRRRAPFRGARTNNSPLVSIRVGRRSFVWEYEKFQTSSTLFFDVKSFFAHSILIVRLLQRLLCCSIHCFNLTASRVRMFRNHRHIVLSGAGPGSQHPPFWLHEQRNQRCISPASPSSVQVPTIQPVSQPRYLRSSVRRKLQARAAFSSLSLVD